MEVSKGAAGLLIEGPKGKMTQPVHPEMGIVIDDKAKQVRVERPSDAKKE